MIIYLVRRLLLAVPTLLLISMVIFAVLALAPGDPLAQLARNPAIPETTRELIRSQFGLDQPLPLRYIAWLTSMLQGNWGFSFNSRSPVLPIILQRVPQTLQVVGSAYLIALALAVPIGIVSAVRQYSFFDHVATLVAFAGFSMPAFLSGLLLILVFSVNLRLFPIVYDSTLVVDSLADLLRQVQQMILPVTVLVIQQMGALTRFLRAAMLDQFTLDYVRTARAKGLHERLVILRHVLRNSLIPVVTLMALGIPTIFSGAIITESLFRVNGLGALLISSIQTSDTPVVMALTFIFACLTILFNLIADLLYAVIDPRVRVG
jgi:peptide/nickel transport system permease protein